MILKQSDKMVIVLTQMGRFPHASITMWCIKGPRNCFTQSHVKSLHCQLLSFLRAMSDGLYIYALKSISSSVFVNGQ